MAAVIELKKGSGELEASVEVGPDLEERRRRIAEAAYYKAEARGFMSGYESEDWLEAEREIEGDSDRNPA